VRELKKNKTIHKTYAILITILNYYYIRGEEYHIELSDRYLLKSFKLGNASDNNPEPLSLDEFNILLKHAFDTDTLKQDEPK